MKIAVLYLWVRGVEQNCEAFMHIYYMGMNLMQQKKEMNYFISFCYEYRYD